MTSFRQPRASIQTPQGEFLISQLSGSEAINQPFCLSAVLPGIVELSADDGKISCLTLEVLGNTRRWQGHITQVHKRWSEKPFTQFCLSSPIAALQKNKSARCFVEQSIQQVITFILRQAGIFRLRWQWHSVMETQPLIVQLEQENELDFICRLLNQANAYLIFEYNDAGEETLCFFERGSTRAKTFPLEVQLHEPNLKPALNGTFQVETTRTYCYDSPNKETSTVIAKSYAPIFLPGIQLEWLADSRQWFRFAFFIQKQEFVLHTHNNQASFETTLHAIDGYKPFRLQPMMAQITEAEIVSTRAQKPELNQAGNYQINLAHYQSPFNSVLNVPRLQPFGQKNGGMHFPLAAGVKILIGFLENDLTQPFILSVLPSEHCPTLYKPAIPYRFIIRTGSQLEWRLDDHPTKAAIVFSHQGNRFGLYQDSPHTLQVEAAHCWQVISGQDFQLQAKEKLRCTLAQSYTLQAERIVICSKQRNIALHSSKNIKLQAQKGIHFQVKIVQNILAEKTLQAKVPGDGVLEAEKGNISIAAQNAAIQAKKEVFFHSKQCQQWQVKGAGFAVNPNSIDIQAPKLYQKAQQKIILHGKNNFAPADHSIDWQEIAALKKVEPFNTSMNQLAFVQQLYWQKTAFTIHEPLQAQIELNGFNGDEKGVLHLYACEADDLHTVDLQHLISIDCEAQAQSIQQVPFDLSDTSLYTSAEIQLGSGQIVIPFTLDKAIEFTPKKKMVYFRFCLAIDGFLHKEASNPMQLFTELTVTLAPKYQREKAELFLARAVLPISNAITPYQRMAFSGKQRLEQLPLFCHSAVKYKDCSGMREFIVKNNTQGFVEVRPDLHSDNSQALQLFESLKLISFYEQPIENTQTALSEYDIDYFRKQGNNMMIFIHGFNVELLPFAHYKGPNWTREDEKHWPKVHCTRYRKQDNLSNTAEWVVHFERELNLAAKSLEDLEKFTRVVFIAWPGAPGAHNYMKANRDSAKLGPKLTQLIAEVATKAPGMQINIIAHSQGNGVLLKGLEYLSREHPRIKINHAFFWEAAIPNDALLPLPQSNVRYENVGDYVQQQIENVERITPWRSAFAHQATEGISILHSQNDNIIGDLLKPAELIDKQCVPEQVYTTKGLAELLPALVTTGFNLHSLYVAANMLSAPVGDILSDSTIEQAWQEWRKLHPQAEIQPTLSEQVEYLKQTRPNILHDIVMHFEVALTDNWGWMSEIAHITYPTGATLVELTSFLASLGFSYFIRKFIARLILSLLKTRIMTRTVAKQVVSYLLNQEHKSLVIKIFAFFDSALVLYPHHPAKALGYEGIPKAIIDLIGEEKIKNYDCVRWIFHHSHMKIPSEDIRKFIYYDIIVDKENLKFGFHIGKGNA